MTNGRERSVSDNRHFEIHFFVCRETSRKRRQRLLLLPLLLLLLVRRRRVRLQPLLPTLKRIPIAATPSLNAPGPRTPAGVLSRHRRGGTSAGTRSLSARATVRTLPARTVSVLPPAVARRPTASRCATGRGDEHVGSRGRVLIRAVRTARIVTTPLTTSSALTRTSPRGTSRAPRNSSQPLSPVRASFRYDTFVLFSLGKDLILSLDYAHVTRHGSCDT